MRSFPLFASLAIAVLATPAVASAKTESPVASVKTDDLDLTTQKGRDTLDRRVQSTIRTMCHSGSRDMVARRMESECRRTALASATRETGIAIAAAQRAAGVRIAATNSADAG